MATKRNPNGSGPKDKVTVRMGEAGIAHVKERAAKRTAVEVKTVTPSEVVRRMLKYAAAHMPADYDSGPLKSDAPANQKETPRG